MKTNRYSDLDIGLNMHPVSKDMLKIVDADSVKNSVKNLLLLGQFEVPFHPELSSGIYDSLFENFLPTTPAILEKQISYTLSNFEPRVTLIGIEIIRGNDLNSMRIDVYFLIKETNEPVVLNLILNRTR